MNIHCELRFMKRQAPKEEEASRETGVLKMNHNFRNPGYYLSSKDSL
jgi:hypothetical protein